MDGVVEVMIWVARAIALTSLLLLLLLLLLPFVAFNSTGGKYTWQLLSLGTKPPPIPPCGPRHRRPSIEIGDDGGTTLVRVFMNASMPLTHDAKKSTRSSCDAVKRTGRGSAERCRARIIAYFRANQGRELVRRRQHVQRPGRLCFHFGPFVPCCPCLISREARGRCPPFLPFIFFSEIKN